MLPRPRNLSWPTYRLAPLPSSLVARLAVAPTSCTGYVIGPDYEAGLQQRGSLTVSFSPQAVEAWNYQGPPQRGAQYTFSELAIQTALTLRLLNHLPLRQTEGSVASVTALMG